MTDKNTNTETTQVEAAKVQEAATEQSYNLRRNTSKIRTRRPKNKREKKEGADEFDVKIVQIRRVTRMYKGGRRMRLSVVVVVGDGKGRVGVGLGKGADVRGAQDKAVANAKKNLVMVSLKGNTVPHEITHKFRAAKILIKPAAPGTGVVAGSSMRMVAEVAGIKDMLGKIFGTTNSITNAYATVEALSLLRSSKL